MDLQIFKKLAYDAGKFTVEEVEDFEFMSDEELNDYQKDLETDSGSLSEWDHLRAFFTLKNNQNIERTKIESILLHSDYTNEEKFELINSIFFD